MKVIERGYKRIVLSNTRVLRSRMCKRYDVGHKIFNIEWQYSKWIITVRDLQYSDLNL